jgi:hypothetical protein
MRRSKGLLRVGTALAVSVALLLPFNSGVSAQSTTAQSLSKLRPELRSHVSGLVDQAVSSTAAGGSATRPVNFFPRQDECGVNKGGNVKINQNCLNVTDSDLQGRGQAQNETAIAVDPNNSHHLVAGYNDYRRGDGTCGNSYSLDGGKSWNDATAPNGFSRGNAGNIQINGVEANGQSFGTPREYWQAGGDPSVAWDTRGNAYYSCQVFNRGFPTSPNPDQSSGFLIFRSTQNDGGSWDFPGRAVIINDDAAGAGTVLEDKQYMGIDDSTNSPFRDRIYVTWTEFTETTAYIYEAFSSDYGQTFSLKHLVTPTATTSICPASLNPGAGCDNNQFSQPFTAPDGTLYVIWANYNTVAGSPAPDPGGDDPGADTGPNAGGAATNAAPTGIDNHFQILLAKSTDGGNTFSAPVKVGDFNELPDCPTYQGGQDPGRSCVPEKGSQNSVFRAANYPSGAVNPSNPSQIVVSYGSYISRFSNEANGCVPQGLTGLGTPLYTGVKTVGACSNKIVVSVSNNSGTTFTGTTQNVRALPTATGMRSQQTTDQWFHWEAFTSRGRLIVSSYDRAFGDSEMTGASDITVASTSDTSALTFDTKRVTGSSMPVPTEFPSAAGASLFWGDYAGVAAAGDNAVPIWSDTREQDIFVCPGTGVPGVPPTLCSAAEPNGLTANDEDIFTDSVNLPGH